MNVNQGSIGTAQDLISFIRYVVENKGVEDVLEKAKSVYAECEKVNADWVATRADAIKIAKLNEAEADRLEKRAADIEEAQEKLREEKRLFRKEQTAEREILTQEKSDFAAEKAELAKLETEVNARLGLAQEIENANAEVKADLENREAELADKMEKLKAITG